MSIFRPTIDSSRRPYIDTTHLIAYGNQTSFFSAALEENVLCTCPHASRLRLNENKGEHQRTLTNTKRRHTCAIGFSDGKANEITREIFRIFLRNPDKNIIIIWRSDLCWWKSLVATGRATTSSWMFIRESSSGVASAVSHVLFGSNSVRTEPKSVSGVSASESN